MCSISGFIGNVSERMWHNAYRLMTSIFKTAERRGTDAAGFCGLTEPYKTRMNSIITAKEPIPASEFITHTKWKSLEHHRLVAAICHNRLFSVGLPSNPKNNHPFVNKAGDIFLIHNGTINNYEQIKHDYSLTVDSDCDSAILLGLIEKCQSIPQAMKLALEIVDGSMAVAILDCSSRLLWLVRDHRTPLWICRFRRLWFFASTSGIVQDGIIDAFGKEALRDIEIMMPMAADNIHVLTVAGKLLNVGR